VKDWPIGKRIIIGFGDVVVISQPSRLEMPWQRAAGAAARSPLRRWSNRPERLSAAHWQLTQS
jgi:hypothetical protein